MTIQAADPNKSLPTYTKTTPVATKEPDWDPYAHTNKPTQSSPNPLQVTQNPFPSQAVGQRPDIHIDSTSQELARLFNSNKLGEDGFIDFGAFKSLSADAQKKLVLGLLQKDEKSVHNLNEVISNLNEKSFEKLVKQFQFNEFAAHGVKLGRNGEAKVGQLADGLLGEKTFYALFCANAGADNLIKNMINTRTNLEDIFKTQAPPVQLSETALQSLYDHKFISDKNQITLSKDTKWDDPKIKELLILTGINKATDSQDVLQSNIEAFKRYLSWHQNSIGDAFPGTDVKLIIPTQEILDAFKAENFDANDRDYDVKASDDEIRSNRSGDQLGPLTDEQIKIARKMVRKVSSEFQNDGFQKVTHSGILPALEILQNKIREIPGYQDYSLTVISGYRDPSYNKRVGGADRSQHMQGKAADIAIPAGMSLNQFFNIVKTIPDFNGGGIGLYHEQGFIHMDVRDGAARWAK